MDRSPSTALSAIQQMDPREFERLVARIWEEQGYETNVTRGSSDRGVDVVARREQPISERILIQAKRHGPTSKVGSGDIQKYSGLYQRDEQVDAVVVVTSNDFTSEATAVAQSRGVKLVNGSKLLSQIQSLDLETLVHRDNESTGSNAVRSHVASTQKRHNKHNYVASDPWKINCPFCSSKVHNATKSLVHHWALSQSCSFDANSPKDIDIIDEEWDTIIERVKEVKQKHQNSTAGTNDRPMSCPFCRRNLERSTQAYVDHFLTGCKIDSPEEIPSERPGAIPREIWWELKDQLEISGLYELNKPKSGTDVKASQHSGPSLKEREQSENSEKSPEGREQSEKSETLLSRLLRKFR